jgi:hypothetical protein
VVADGVLRRVSRSVCYSCQVLKLLYQLAYVLVGTTRSGWVDLESLEARVAQWTDAVLLSVRMD